MLRCRLTRSLSREDERSFRLYRLDSFCPVSKFIIPHELVFSYARSLEDGEVGEDGLCLAVPRSPFI